MKQIFISYSHKDKDWLELLTKHLEVAELEGHFQTWDDRQLGTGDEWYPVLMKQLEQAQVVIFLVSADFLTSDFIRKEEVARALEYREQKGTHIFPLLVRPCLWDEVPRLSRLQFFPEDNIALSEMDEPVIEKQLTLFGKALLRLIKTEPATAGAGLLTPLPMSKVSLLGRERELEELENKLKETRRILLVNGMGGIGKTEVCKEFFLRHHGQYRYAAWVDYVGSLKESLVNTLGAEDSKLIPTSPADTLETRFKAVKQALEHLGGNALLVVDNVGNPEDELRDWLTRLPFKVIANSRATVTGFETFPLDVLSPGCCRSLFYEHYQGEADDENLDKIIHRCHRHTLTVELLARLARNAWMEIKTLHDTLVEKGFNLNEVVKDGIETVWHNEGDKKKFFDHLLKVFELSGLTGEEIAVLTNLSVLPAEVPVNDFCEWMELESRDVLNALVKKGWLKRKGHLLFMHNILQEVIRHHTQPDVEKCFKLIDNLGWKLKLEPADNPIAKQVFVPFADSLSRFISDKDNDLAALANNLSLRYLNLGLLPKALEFQLKAVSIREEILDSQHPDLATSYNNLSLIYKDLGQLEKALGFQLKAVSIREEILDSKHPDLATSYNNLSSIYQAQGQLEKALEFQLKATESWEESLDENHPLLATSYNNLAMIYEAKHNNEDALEYYDKAIAIMEFLFPKGHPNLDVIRENKEMLEGDD